MKHARTEVWKRYQPANGFGLACVIAVCTACATRIDDLTQVPPFSEHINERYVLQSDCYVFQYTREKRREPSIGSGRINSFLPKTLDPQLIGKQFNHVTLIGILRKNTVFRIVSLKREKTFESTYYTYFISLEGPVQPWPVLNASLITNELKTPPVIQKEIATRIENRENP